MTTVIVCVVLAVMLLCAVSIIWDSAQIERTRRACLRGDHRYCTSKSPWHFGPL